MSLEVQRKVINPLIADTANHIRQISASLIPLIMMSGQQNNAIMTVLSSFVTMSNDTADLIDQLEITDKHRRFDAAYVIPYDVTKFLITLEKFLNDWDYANSLGNHASTSSKVIDFSSSERSIHKAKVNTQNYHLSSEIKSSRLIPQQAVIELLMEYLELYRIPENDYIDELMGEYVPKIEEVYNSIYESLNIDRNIKALALVTECLQKVSAEYKKYFDEDDEWV